MEVGTRSLEEHGMKRDHLSIEITNEDNLASSIKKKMESFSLSIFICRVPEELSKRNEQSYFPSSVSIGPFHHGKGNLKAMEDQKLRYFNTLLGRNQNTQVILENCINALRHLEQKARKFYAETINMGSNQFVEMMLLDGCFVIELFLEYGVKSLRHRDDISFTTRDKLFNLRSDLILFENQVPFFILDQLFNLVPIPKQCSFSLIELALHFFRKLIPGETHQEKVSPEVYHLLDLIRLQYLPTIPEVTPSGQRTHMPPATHLHPVGITLQEANRESPLNITFFDGELEIPPLKIHSHTEILFRNLIAMELCHPKCPKQVTSYVVFMGRLIQSKRDARLLKQKKIIVGWNDQRLGEVPILFERLNLDINMKDFYYRGVCEEIRRYQIRKQKVWWLDMKHIYHRTHLGVAGLSLAMLFLVFIFTGGFLAGLTFLLHRFQ